MYANRRISRLAVIGRMSQWSVVDPKPVETLPGWIATAFSPRRCSSLVNRMFSSLASL